ncbi:MULTISPECIES: IS110 family transposase [Nocardia]|nr:MULTISPECIES: IS110 family transposase [Nocardia]MCP2293474.1 Transposase [Nocardia amikacinitolerans]MCZ9330061.1 IS110 family transposase [Nocardia farcinica]PEH80021.1 IS110 family transposase [Nocardia sp. FDAARGOS_372]TLF94239.1 IS110 family transposase [Nocardia cyriacigeorgica]UEX22269.1 IS110 family transposase [Nocardia farcinica]
MAQIWAGVDIGKTGHHCVVINTDGKRLLSRRIANDEPELVKLIDEVRELGQDTVWAVDLPDGGAALLIGLLVERDQQLLYIPGRTLNRVAGGYRGEGKTDARDAAIIADQARMRRDLHPLRPGDEVTIELKLLTTRRADLVADRTRAINRLRGLLSGIFPALDRAFDNLTLVGPLTLLTGYQTPAALRRTGASRLETWLSTRKVRNPGKVAAAAIEAAARQHTRLPGEALTASMVAALAEEVMALNERIKEADKLIEGRFHRHELAEVIISLPGIGTLLGAEFLAATGGDMDYFGTPDRLAGFAGLAPAAWDSGRIRGNLHRPKRYHRGLNRVFYQSAMISISCSPESRTYDRKRGEGKKHTQAVLALVRRRVNVLWALIREKRPYQPLPPVAVAA